MLDTGRSSLERVAAASYAAELDAAELDAEHSADSTTIKASVASIEAALADARSEIAEARSPGGRRPAAGSAGFTVVDNFGASAADDARSPSLESISNTRLSLAESIGDVLESSLSEGDEAVVALPRALLLKFSRHLPAAIATFQRMDTDQNGRLTLEEFAPALQVYGISGEQAKQVRARSSARRPMP